MIKFIALDPLTHSIKTVIAMLIGFFIALFIEYPANQWVLITVVVVMCAQMFVGSVVTKGYLRFLGTLIGCLFATVALALFGNSTTAILTAIIVSSFFFSYLAATQEKLSYAATLGAITTIIIMINPHPTVLLAAQRFLEISVGIFIATMVSQFVLPIHAGSHLRRLQAETLTLLKDYYSAVMMKREHEFNYQDLDENIAKTLIKQRQLAKESAREPLGKEFDPTHFMESLYCEREILRSITFMHHALLNLKQVKPRIDQLPSLHIFNEAILQIFDNLINGITGKEPPSYHTGEPPLDHLNNDLQKEINGDMKGERIYIDGFLFAALLLRKSLNHLNKLNSRVD